MALAFTSVLMVEQVSKNGYCQHLCPPPWIFPLVSPEGSSRSAGGSNSGFFQITASVLGFGACEILFVPFRGNLLL